MCWFQHEGVGVAVGIYQSTHHGLTHLALSFMSYLDLVQFHPLSSVREGKCLVLWAKSVCSSCPAMTFLVSNLLPASDATSSCSIQYDETSPSPALNGWPPLFKGMILVRRASLVGNSGMRSLAADIIIIIYAIAPLHQFMDQIFHIL